MTSIGDTLRRERQRRNLDLANIAGELKISVRFLDAMERDDFAKLPGGVFAKSFVRQYAAFLGLDAREVGAEIERAMAPEPVAHVPEETKPTVPGLQLEFADRWRTIGEGRTSWPAWIRSGILLVVLMLVCSGVYWWWERPHHQALARETPPAPSVIPAAQLTPPVVSQPVANSPVAAAQPTTDVTGSNTTSTQPPAGKPADSAVTPATPVSNPNASVHVGITADEAVWVRAEVNGKTQFEGVMQPHESRNIDADGEVKLRLGNAGGATITYNGKPIGPVGPKGQIRNVQFTSGGFQIASPPRSLDPFDRL